MHRDLEAGCPQLPLGMCLLHTVAMMGVVAHKPLQTGWPVMQTDKMNYSKTQPKVTIATRNVDDFLLNTEDTS
jgi:hypothetical protein